ncbi:MAG: chemotaxis protein CheW, partial [Ferrovum sp.]|nr:chemotaxis protein CheW [Ferrovum sp.]
MKKRKATSLHNPPSTLARFMSGLYPDQKRLNEIQTVYDNLTLLGQLLCAGTDISRMRSDFNNLASVLLDQLAMEYYKKASLHLDSCARVAIDILTRNLFERTADIGFLATDSEIRKYAEAVEENPETTNSLHWKKVLGSHFMEYVQKYSVYHNIILLSPQGEVLAQLDTNNFVERTTDSLVREALNTDHAYVEISRPTDLLPGLDNPLVYAYRVMSSDDSHPVGVLCLCFRLQDECRRIFENLVAEDDWTIITLLDSEQRVIASSD